MAVLFTKIVSGVKELLSPRTTPGILTEVDLSRWPGREVELRSEDGSVCRIVIGESVRLIRDQYVDNVAIDRASTGPRPVIMQRRISLGAAVIYTESVEGGWENDRFRRYDAILNVARIAIQYPD